MSTASTGNATGSLNDANAAPLDVICKSTVATSCRSRCQNFRLMHLVSVSSDFHYGKNSRSMIESVSNLMEMSLYVFGVFVSRFCNTFHTILLLSDGSRRVCANSALSHRMVTTAFSMGVKRIESIVVFHNTLSYHFNEEWRPEHTTCRLAYGRVSLLVSYRFLRGFWHPGV